ncbi:extracellular solute-binding protein [Paenibacillus alkalitolerans]|uniref:extracellular solute-binding protein n=1 Tax=Paenibacillus alkalitolerans TaxID=2799335 RepID=UPI0018F5FF20|nr:extracellular solute-binding protein [Paenibacillus alkalitolerans]
MKYKRKWPALILVLALTVFVSACGGASGSSESTSGSNESTSGSSESTSGSGESTSEPSNETVELTLWSDWMKDDPYTEQYYARMEQFKAEHPNIKINMEVIPYNEYNLKLQTQAAGGQLPDVMQLIIGGTFLEPLARAGLLMPIDDMIGEWKDTKIPEGLLKEFAVDGKQYAIPAEVNYSSMVFYNKKLLADLGYTEFPKTYSELLALIKAANDNKITPIILGNKTGTVLPATYLSVITDRIAGSGFIEQVLAKEKKLTDPEFISALNIIKELADNNAFNKDANNIDAAAATDRFVNGQALMYIDGSWVIKPIIANKASGFEFGMAVFPSIEGGKGDPMSLPAATYQGLGINAKLDDKKKEAAKTFVKFMYGDELFTSLLEGGALVSANVEVPGNLDPDFQAQVELTQRLTGISTVFGNVMPKDVGTAVNNSLQGLILGSVTPDKVAEDAQKLLR